MSRVPTRRGGGGGGLTLVIILVLMMCVSVIMGAGGYMLFKPKKDTEDAEDAEDAEDDTVADLKAKVEALENDDNADPVELATAQAELTAAEDADTGNDTPAAVNCVGTWSGWGDCSQSCGGGIQTQEWTTTTEPLHGGTVCPSPSTETQVCNEQACPVATNCIGAWSGWGACSETCGGGIQSQNYAVSTDETNGGTCTERGQTNEKPCNEQDCPLNPDSKYAITSDSNGRNLAMTGDFRNDGGESAILRPSARGSPQQVHFTYDESTNTYTMKQTNTNTPRFLIDTGGVAAWFLDVSGNNEAKWTIEKIGEGTYVGKTYPTYKIKSKAGRYCRVGSDHSVVMPSNGQTIKKRQTSYFNCDTTNTNEAGLFMLRKTE